MKNELNNTECTTKIMKVTAAGYRYCGHYRSGNIRILLESDGGIGCFIYPEDQFTLYDLFEVFDLPCEAGAYIEDLVGKCCVVTFNSKLEPIMLKHLVTDKSYRVV